MAIVHTIWQRLQDRKDAAKGGVIGNKESLKKKPRKRRNGFYALSSYFRYLARVSSCTSVKCRRAQLRNRPSGNHLACLFVVIVVELLRQRELFGVVGQLATFFKGMGNAADRWYLLSSPQAS